MPIFRLITPLLPRPGSGEIAVLVAITGGALVNLDMAMVMIALPRVASDLAVPPAQVHWILAAPVLIYALGLLPFGRLGDGYGRRRVFLAGGALLALGAALAALAPSFTWLLVGRIAQGLGGAALLPQVLALVAGVLAPDRRPRAFQTFATVGGLVSIAGPVLGGALATSPVGWRGVFVTDAAAALLMLAAARLAVPQDRTAHHASFDWFGLTLFGSGILGLLVALSEGRTQHWPWWSGALLLGGGGALVAFVVWVRHRARRRQPHLLPATLLRRPAFLVWLALVLLLLAGPPGLFAVLSQAVQMSPGLDPIAAGKITAAFPVGVVLARFAVTPLLAWPPIARLTIGTAALALGMAWLAIALSAPLAADALIPATWPPLILAGTGMGLAITVLFQNAMATAPPRLAGAASGALQTAQHLGVATGLAICSGLFAAALSEAGATPMTALTALVVRYHIALFVGIGTVAATGWLLAGRLAR